MFRNDYCSVLGDVASSFLGSFLHYKTTKPAEVNIFHLWIKMPLLRP